MWAPLALCLALAASIAAAEPAPQPYLKPGALDAGAILPPPPKPGSAGHDADAAAYAATRALAGSPRWHLATADVPSGVGALLGDFSCAAGRQLDPTRLPALAALLARTRRDVVTVVRDAKAHFARLRPHLGNDAPLCVDRTEALDKSFAYPSGHATEGWTFGLVLAALMRERATALLDRGRIYGESRIVCGVHWASDVEAGRLAGSALFAALVGDPAFRADLDRARAEFATAPSGPAPEPAACAREKAAPLP
ncbi:acid phosphatase [Methylobacterium frigidaeris]|uniref:Acid phosphatase n=1 Tax=Methylobacterium frigidaeris TaxID=2038277 RepID=A0AA37H8G0_9HYPH|nr:phosphatase PAP2 family protein [Methylobacterium frigidaeris]PIK71164.1 acid phosphatase [Methylobacterium frigidaeris]GJD61250.1 Major phosphate-irrepressible acid phosphatase [Methylobacterium frigidaeris]